MSLPTGADLKTYLRRQNTAEDALMQSLVDQAKAAIRGILGRPIDAEEISRRVWPRPHRRLYSSPQTLMVPNNPCDWATLEIKDIDDAVLDSAEEYWTPDNPWDLQVYARDGISFSNGPYTVTVTCGLAVLDDWTYVVEPSLFRAIIALGADWYQRRNPSASSETSAGGVSHTYSALGIPPQVIEVIRPWIRQRAV